MLVAGIRDARCSANSRELVIFIVIVTSNVSVRTTSVLLWQEPTAPQKRQFPHRFPLVVSCHFLF